MSKLNIMTGICMFFCFSTGNRMYVAQDLMVNIFCEEDDHLSINCPAKKTVVLKDVIHDEWECKEDSDEVVCSSNTFTNLNTYCVGNNNCSIPSSNLFKENCRRTPRNIEIQYSCNYFGWTGLWGDKRSKEICASDLSKINCNHNRWRTIIKINDIGLQTENHCSTCNKENVKQSRSILCNTKNVCSNPENEHPCLFHQRYINVKYWCKDENYTLPEGSTTLEDTVTSTSSSIDFNKNNTYVSFASSVFETSSPKTTETTFAPEEQPSIAIDWKGRVLINAGNTNFTICSFKWDDNDANVICRSINNTPMGKAKQMHGYNQNTTIPIDFHCIGNETSLDVCKRSFNYDECNILTVAAVICCNDDGTSPECSNIMAPKANQISSSDFNLGLVIGTVLGSLLLAGVVILTLIFIRRSNCLRKNKKTSHSNVDTNDYTGTQDIAMPIANGQTTEYIGLDRKVNNKQYHDISSGAGQMKNTEYDYTNISKVSNEKIIREIKNVKSDRNRTVGDEESNVISHTEYAVVDPIKRIESPFNLEFDNNAGNDYLVLDPNETGFNSLEGPPSTTGSYELAKPIEDSGYRKDKKGIETNSVNLYACSEDGVYDSAHGNGHTESESNVYSHTVDNVYDSSSHTRQNAETEDNYDHFTGKKTQDDYDISK